MIVYLDSNVYISAKYIFENNSLGTLKNLVDNSKVTVLYTSATIGEVKQYIKDDIGAAITKYNRILRKDLPALCSDSSCALRELNADKSINDVIAELDSFLEKDFVEKVSLNPIDVETLMDDYFNQRPPFESKKPNEFKDAIMINAIKNYRPMTGVKVCVVSNDEGFRKAFEDNENFITFKFLGDFLKYYTSSEEILALIAEAISDEVAEGMHDDIIKEYISDFDIDRGYYAEWNIDSGDIDEIECELLYVEKLESSYIANFSVDVDISIDITYRDEDRSYYDKEEESYLIEHYIHAIEHHRFNVIIAIECEIEQDEKIISVVSANVLENTRHKYINLDEDTLYDSDEIDDSVREEPDLEYCSECGKLLGRTMNGACFDLDENPLCESCMTSDSNGEVCPMCGRKVPHEYMMSGFCKDCAPN